MSTKIYYIASSTEAEPCVCIERGDCFKQDGTPRYYNKDAQGEFILDEHGNKIPDTDRTYGSPDVPHGRQSVLWMSCRNCLADPCTPQFELPDWTNQEKSAIKADCRAEVVHDNPKRQLTEEEVLDRYYKHDPETGERTDEPTGEFESIEACRAAMQQEIDDQWEEMINFETEDYFKAKMDNCVIAPAAMANFEQSHPFMDLVKDNPPKKKGDPDNPAKVWILNLDEKDFPNHLPLTLKEKRRLKEKSNALENNIVRNL